MDKEMNHSKGIMDILPKHEENIKINPADLPTGGKHEDYGHPKIGKDNKLEGLKY